MIRHFLYKIKDPAISKEIQVDLQKTKTFDDLKFKFAQELCVGERNIKIENLPKTKNLEKVSEQYPFELTIENKYPNVTFVFPNGIKIKIDNCYRLHFNQILKRFQKEHIYYSIGCCRNNFHFYVSQKELHHTDYPFLSPSSDKADVKLTGDTVYIKYGFYRFFFTDNEPSSEAYKILHKIYENRKVLIYNEKNKPVSEKDTLKKKANYKIFVECKFVFEDLNPIFFSFPKTYFIDLLSTVGDAQNIIAKNMSNFFVKYKPSEIAILDKDRKMIRDQNKKLLTIHPTSNTTIKFVTIEDNSNTGQNKGQSKKWSITFKKSTDDVTILRSRIDPDTEIKILIKQLKKLLNVNCKINILLPDGTKTDRKKKIKDYSKEMRRPQKGNLLIIDFVENNKKHHPKSDKKKKGKNFSSSFSHQKSQGQNKGKSFHNSYIQKPQKLSSDDDSDDRDYSEDRSDNEDKNIQKTINHSKSDDPAKKKIVKKKTVVKKNPEAKTVKYNYVINSDEETKVVELDEKATVKDMKIQIAEDNDVDDNTNIKILFAGKELLSKLVVNDLGIGDITIFVYIRPVEEVFLQTAKALRVDKKISDDDEDDDNNETDSDSDSDSDSDDDDEDDDEDDDDNEEED